MYSIKDASLIAGCWSRVLADKAKRGYGRPSNAMPSGKLGAELYLPAALTCLQRLLVFIFPIIYNNVSPRPRLFLSLEKHVIKHTYKSAI